MTNNKRLLSGVSQTLWVPLLSRAQASAQPHTTFHDATAEVVADHLRQQGMPSRFVPPPLSSVLVARAKHYDQAALNFLKDYPRGQIVQLGCGLDSRFERLPQNQRGKASQWWHLDLPEVMALRRALLRSEQQLTSSVTDFSWLQALDPDRPTLLQAEGLLMYLSRQEIHRCFIAWCRYFLQAEVVAELTHQWWIPLLRTPVARQIFQLKMQTQDAVTFQGGLLSPQEPIQWHRNILYRKHWTYGEAFIPAPSLWKRMPALLWTGHYGLGVLSC